MSFLWIIGDNSGVRSLGNFVYCIQEQTYIRMLNYQTFSPEVVEAFEKSLDEISIDLSEYYSRITERKINVNNYLEREPSKNGNFNEYWISLEKLRQDLHGNGLIVIFDCATFPSAYKTSVVVEGEKESETITHIHILQLSKIRYAFGKETIKKKKPQKTYLMKDMSTGYIKIGKSSNPGYREKTLQSEKPTIELLFVIESAVEKELHDKYDYCRIRGEWFELNQKEIEAIKSQYLN